MKNGILSYRIGKVALLLTVALLFLFIWSCAGNKAGSAPDAAEESEAVGGNANVGEAQQNAESAEWEAHRLREELHRKKSGD